MSDPCGIFIVVFNNMTNGTACAAVLSITIGGTAIPFLIIGLMCILCWVAARNRRRRKKKRSVTAKSTCTKQEKKSSKEDMPESPPQEEVKLEDLQILASNEIDIDLGLYDSIDQPVLDRLKQARVKVSVANSRYEQTLDADKYDYISHDQHKERTSVPEISTTQSDQNSRQQYEPRPYEEFRKHELPVYAEPNKKLKSKMSADKPGDKETQNSASNLSLGVNNTCTKRISMPPPQESSEGYSKLRADLGNEGQNRRSLNLVSDGMYSTIDVAPPLPPPMVQDAIPAPESSSKPKHLGMGSRIQDDKKTKSSQDLSQERNAPYKNVNRECLRVCNSSDQLQQKNGADILYYSTVSRENLNNFSGSEGSNSFYDRPPKSDVEPGEIHQDLYMNV